MLLSNIDGSHIKARGDNRSFEAMVATVFRPEALEYVDKNHNPRKSMIRDALKINFGNASIDYPKFDWYIYCRT
jgi:hypothetical protein